MKLNKKSEKKQKALKKAIKCGLSLTGLFALLPLTGCDKSNNGYRLMGDVSRLESEHPASSANSENAKNESTQEFITLSGEVPFITTSGVPIVPDKVKIK